MILDDQTAIVLVPAQTASIESYELLQESAEFSVRKTILTVDDAATMRKVIMLALMGMGHDVLEAEDGVAGLEVLKMRHVDLIISDVNMPRMNGIEFTKQVRLLPQFQKTPLLLLTTESDPTIKSLGKAAGASGWIVKPFRQEQLVAVVGKVLPA